ncbi:MAG: hypothetical protein KQJ78_08510 [Deltaproteobacteria bacterium]|nr:hypothetical protein [Deltaproteobacteria bacterium]
MLDRLAEIFLNKPELVTQFPPWMLSPERARQIAASPGWALVELAGRDSVAAALAAVRERGFTGLVPTLAYTGTEHGAWAAVPQALERLLSRLPAGVETTELVLLGSPNFWRALCGRPLQLLARRLGFSPVCVGCHLYFHAVRLPLARRLGGIPIISGERESHDGRLKLNQLAFSLDAYHALAGEFGVELMLPLRQVSRGEDITAILNLAWPEGGEQLGCALSGNYLDAQGRAAPEEKGLPAYLRDFALPLARAVVAGYLAGETLDHLALARQTPLWSADATA